MKISALLATERPTVSCELFPPKKDGRLVEADAIVHDTVALHPDFISVTYGAGGGARHNTIRMAQAVAATGARALAHLTCVSAARADIAAIVEELQAANIENVLALRGDIPAEGFPSPGHYAHAVDLVAELHARGGFCIGAACYPEGHVESASRKDDIRYLKEKVDAGCHFLITQMFFDNNVLYKFLYKIREAGISVPVLAGIMPVTNKAQIARMVEMSGCSFPPRFSNIVDKFGGCADAMQQAGIAYATEQIIDLLANGVRGVHIYTMNKPWVAGQIMANISRIVEVPV